MAHDCGVVQFYNADEMLHTVNLFNDLQPQRVAAYAVLLILTDTASMPTTTATPPRLSIVIPAPGDESTLEETLVSVLENRPENSEIVVVLGFGYHDPWNVCEEVRFIQALLGPTVLHV